MQMTNAELAQFQLTKHGRDRYPSVHEQMIKLVEEVGELAKEINRPPHKQDLDKIGSEAADVALALYNLCTKCVIDLDHEIAIKVVNDTRSFV